jgi:tetratricopeptide (TPR) repeat protein
MYKRVFLTAGLLFFVWAALNAQDVDTKIDNIKSTLINSDYEAGLKECEALLQTGISDTMKLAMVYGYAGLSSEALKHKTEAIYYYKKAVALQMPQLDVYDKLINLSKKEKNDSIYEYALLEKLKVFPEYSDEVKKSLAYLYLNTKQYEKLLNVSGELIVMFPDDANYKYFKGLALQNLNRTEEAKLLYLEVIKINPDHAGANMSLGLILYNDGSEIFLKKKKEYESIAKPDRVDYHNYDVGIEKGRVLYRQALPHLQKAYESGSYPDLKPIIFNAYIRLEQKEKAEPYR